MTMLLDIEYVILGLPAIAFSIWAQSRGALAYAAGKRMIASSGLTGAQAALRVMHAGGVSNVAIETASGQLANYFVPSHRLLRLSGRVYHGRSLTALGIAAHESGHAIQGARWGSFHGLVLRSVIVPLSVLSSTIFWIIMLAALAYGMMKLILFGLLLFSIMVVLQLVNLPLEYDASRRSRQVLLSSGLVSRSEEEVLERILRAAAWTDVGATLTTFPSWVRYVAECAVMRGSEPGKSRVGASRKDAKRREDQV
jgi:Zn-dependent membrane protease YugP